MRDEKATQKMAEDGQRGFHIQKIHINQQARTKFKQLHYMVLSDNNLFGCIFGLPGLNIYIFYLMLKCY